jgi:ribosomal protein S18
MQTSISHAWKIAATALAILPGLYSVVYFMVQAKMEATDKRLEYLEYQAQKGERFTSHDGAILERTLTNHLATHQREVDQLRTHLNEARYENAAAKANISNLQKRFLRMEDKLFTLDTNPQLEDFRKAPHRPHPYQFDNYLPVGVFYTGFRDG